MATFNETPAPTSRKHVSEQSKVMSSWSKTFQTFWSHSSVSTLGKEPKNLNFHQYTRAPTSRKYVTLQGIVMPNWSKTFQNLRSHSPVFRLENQPKNRNFQSSFTSKRHFGGYFHWNACTYFQKTCIWTRYSDIKLINKISNFLVAHLGFDFRKTT